MSTPNPEMMPDRAPEVHDGPARFAGEDADAINVGIARHVGPQAPAIIGNAHHVMGEHESEAPKPACGLDFAITGLIREGQAAAAAGGAS